MPRGPSALFGAGVEEGRCMLPEKRICMYCGIMDEVCTHVVFIGVGDEGAVAIACLSWKWNIM